MFVSHRSKESGCLFDETSNNPVSICTATVSLYVRSSDSTALLQCKNNISKKCANLWPPHSALKFMQGKEQGCTGWLRAPLLSYSVKATTYADIIFHATKIEYTITITLLSTYICMCYTYIVFIQVASFPGHLPLSWSCTWPSPGGSKVTYHRLGNFRLYKYSSVKFLFSSLEYTDEN